MIPRSFFALGALAFVQLASALAFNGPQPTLGERLAANADGVSPRPTQAPEGHHVELLKRAIALPRTCGWLYDAKASQSSLYACGGVGGAGTCAYYSSSGTAAQGCCASGLTSCVVPTTCYDYAQYTSSSCNSACQSNDFNLVCSRSTLGKCQTYYFPARGVTGYGCDTDTESTRTSVFTTFVSTPLISTGIPTTFTAFMSIAPAYALTAGNTGFGGIFPTTTATTRRTVTFGAATTTSRYYNSPYYDDDTSAAISGGLIAVIVILVIIWAIPSLFAFGALIWFCHRHKRYMSEIDQQNAARAAGFGAGNRGIVSAVPYNNSNVVMPGSHQSGYYGPPDPNQASYYAGKGSPNMTQTYPAPMPTPPPVSGSPAPTYVSNAATNTNSVYGFPPGQTFSPPAPGQAFSPQQAQGQGFPLQQSDYATPQPQPQAQAQPYQPPAVSPAGVSNPAPQATTRQLHELQ